MEIKKLMISLVIRIRRPVANSRKLISLQYQFKKADTKGRNRYHRQLISHEESKKLMYRKVSTE